MSTSRRSILKLLGAAAATPVTAPIAGGLPSATVPLVASSQTSLAFKAIEMMIEVGGVDPLDAFFDMAVFRERKAEGQLSPHFGTLLDEIMENGGENGGKSGREWEDIVVWNDIIKKFPREMPLNSLMDEEFFTPLLQKYGEDYRYGHPEKALETMRVLKEMTSHVQGTVGEAIKANNEYLRRTARWFAANPSEVLRNGEMDIIDLACGLDYKEDDDEMAAVHDKLRRLSRIRNTRLDRARKRKVFERVKRGETEGRIAARKVLMMEVIRHKDRENTFILKLERHAALSLPQNFRFTRVDIMHYWQEGLMASWKPGEVLPPMPPSGYTMLSRGVPHEVDVEARAPSLLKLLERDTSSGKGVKFPNRLSGWDRS